MLELAFAAWLVFVFPALQLWRSLRPKQKSARVSQAASYLKSMRKVGAMLAVLAALMVYAGRGPDELGLDIPISLFGQWGLGVCALLLVGSVVGTWIWEQRLDQAGRDNYHAKLQAMDTMPRTPRDLALFAVLTLFIGIGWELLYRGFLILALTPVVGTVGAVVLAALAYGIGHGYQSRGQFIGSIVSAFLFTIAYVLTASLWWLMLLHVMLPLYAAVSSYLTLRAAGKLPGAVA